MNYPLRRWPTAVRVLALVLAVASLPLPALAAEGSDPPQAAKKGLQEAIGPVVHAVVVAQPPAARSQEQAADPKTVLESKSFFKTTMGAVVIGVLAVAGGYAIYSTRHDRINSPAR